MKPQIALGIASLAVLAACSDTPAPTQSLSPPDAAAMFAAAVGPQYVPGEVIVKFRATTSAGSRGAALKAASATAGEHILTAAMRNAGDGEGISVLHTSMSVPAAIRALRNSADVEYAEPNYVYQHEVVSNDPYYTDGSLWGMYGDATSPANQYGSQAGEAWAVGHNNCSTVYVGVIDEGRMYTHEDLAANTGKNPGEIAGDGIDNDRNGYVDDVYGWDFANNDNTIFDGTGDDHGTHVSGTIGGVGGNGIGVAGVCWSVKVIQAKFLGRNGGTTANAVKAVDYMTDLKTRDGINLVATSNSWGGGGFSQALGDAIGRANTANILFIAAAGNSTLDCDVSDCYPAKYTNANMIAVAALTSTGDIASYSNYGATTIHIGAPGSGVWSSVPASSKGKIVSSYASYNGTSMATPHVSGGAALYAAYHPGSSAATIKNAILASAVPTPSMSGKTVSGGRLNVSAF